MKFCYENMSKGTKFQDYCIDYLYSIGKRPGEPHCPDTFRYKKNAIHI